MTQEEFDAYVARTLPYADSLSDDERIELLGYDEILLHDLIQYIDGYNNYSTLLDCFSEELISSINQAEREESITSDTAQFLRVSLKLEAEAQSL